MIAFRAARLMSRRFAPATIAAAAVLCVPASAAAVTGVVSKPCYSHLPARGSEPVVVALAGGTPGASFLVSAAGAGQGLGSEGSVSGTFDAAGNATAEISNVSLPSGSIKPSPGEAVGLTVTDYGPIRFGGMALDTLVAAMLVTNIAIDVGQSHNPRAHRVVAVSGTPFAGRAMYAFVVHGNSRKVLRRISLGTANICGYVRARAVVAPRNFRRGSYRLYVNAGSRLDKPHSVGFSFHIT